MNDRRISNIAQMISNYSVSGRMRVAGEISFKKDQGPIRRDIRVKGFEWSPESLRNLAKILWAAQRSQSYAMGALRLFSKMNSSEFSPDGLLGGKGYIQNIKDMRNDLSKAVETLSSFIDTVHDEINADHWSTVSDEPEIQDIVHDADQVKLNPEGFVENSFDNANLSDMDDDFDQQSNQNPSADDMNPSVEPMDDSGDESDEDDLISRTSSGKAHKPGSNLPVDESDQEVGLSDSEVFMHTTIPDRGNYASAIDRMLGRNPRMASNHVADSSIPVETLSGPRVDHIGPAAGSEAGHFNYDEVWPSDDPLGEGFSHLEPIYEDGNNDGVTGYGDPTDGDSSVLQVSSLIAGRMASYSWLPGSKNEKNLDYYARGLSSEEVEWMKSHNFPDIPKGIFLDEPKESYSNLWNSELR